MALCDPDLASASLAMLEHWLGDNLKKYTLPNPMPEHVRAWTNEYLQKSETRMQQMDTLEARLQCKAKRATREKQCITRC